MAGYLGYILWFLQTFWYLIPLLAFIAWLLAVMAMRTVMNRVEYHHRGGTRTRHSCQIQGTNITFRPYRRSMPITVPIVAAPETEVKGLSTYRIYHVSEGGGSTYNFSRDFDEDIREARDSIEAVYDKAESRLTMKDTRKVLKTLSDLLKVIMPVNVNAVEKSSHPESQAAASSISMFQAMTSWFAAKLPKTRGDYTVMIIIGVMGFGLGMAWGMLVGGGYFS